MALEAIQRRIENLSKEFHDRSSDLSPEPGTEECICAKCGNMIGRDERDPAWKDHDEDCIGCAVCEFPIRIYSIGADGKATQELRFHPACFAGDKKGSES